MRKKIALAFAVVFAVAALQWAVASVDTQPAATQQVTEEAVPSCPEGKTQCPKAEATTTSAATCPKTDAASCPKAEATTTSTSTDAASCTKAEGAKCPYSSSSGATKS